MPRWFAGFVLLCLPITVGATTAVSLNLEQLVKRADRIVDGKVAEVQTKFDKKKGLVYTLYKINVLESLKGRGNTVVVRVPGGTYNGIVQVVSGTPQFKKGERVFLFLTQWKRYFFLVGLSQGAFIVKPDRGIVERRLNRLTLIGEPSRIPRTLKELKARVNELLHNH